MTREGKTRHIEWDRTEEARRNLTAESQGTEDTANLSKMKETHFTGNPSVPSSPFKLSYLLIREKSPLV